MSSSQLDWNLFVYEQDWLDHQFDFLMALQVFLIYVTRVVQALSPCGFRRMLHLVECGSDKWDRQLKDMVSLYSENGLAIASTVLLV